MKLAELLIKRKNARSKLAHLQERLKANAKVQEGDSPQESPVDLLREAREVLVTIHDLSLRINRTNAGTGLADKLVLRDSLVRERNILSSLLDAVQIKEGRPYYGRMEIKFTPCVEASTIKKALDELIGRYEALDSEIQKQNWETEAL